MNEYKVLSLFSGICGLDIGFGHDVIIHKNSISDDFRNNIESNYNIENFVKLKNHNFKIIFQNDILKGAKQICDINNISNNYIIKSIYDLIKEDYKFPFADVITGGFPCCDFSHAGKRQGFNSKVTHDLKEILNEDNSRGKLYKCFISVINKVKPKIFVAENVYGLLTMKNKPIDNIINELSEIGYDVNYSLIKANEHGIPQKRWRVIIIGINKIRKEQKLDKDWYIINENKISCPIKYYYEHLQEPDETNDIAQQLFSKAKKLNKGQGQTEINLESFAPTIRAEHHGNIEFRRHTNSINKNENNLKERRLTLREVGLAQTFPPNFIFNIKDNMTSYKYIGNAIPPLLSYLIANKVKNLLLKYF